MKRLMVAALAFFASLAVASAQIISGGGSPGGSGYYAVYQAYPNAALTGTTSETNQAAVRIPANTLGSNGVIRLTATWSCTNNADNKTISIRFNATSGATSGSLAVSTVQTAVTSIQTQVIIRNAGATNAQSVYPGALAPFGTNASAVNGLSIDTTADSFININGTLAIGTDTLTLLGYTIEVTHP